MNTKSTLVALLAACTMFACAAEEMPEESTDAPTVVQAKSEDPAEGNDKQASDATITPQIAASGWCVTGYHFGRNWSYCCYDDGDCQFWSQ